MLLNILLRMHFAGLHICVDIDKLNVQLGIIKWVIAWVVASQRGRSRSRFETAIAKRSCWDFDFIQAKNG